MFDDKHTSLYFQQIYMRSFQTRIIDILSYLFVILGIIGNLFGFLIFSLSRRARRRSPIYVCLATSSSITNVLCVIRYGSILNSRSQYVLLNLIGRAWWACKIYEFSFSFRVISSWITLFWMFERLICISTRLQAFFHRWNSFKLKFIIPIFILMIILGCVIGPSVYMFEPQILNKTIPRLITNNIHMYCKLDSNATDKWRKYFNDVHFGANHSTIRCLFSELIPAGVIILFDSCIIYHLAHICQSLHQIRDHKLRQKQSRTTSWMNIVLVLHSLLFLLSFSSHVIVHWISIQAHETWWVSLTTLINCSSNFYVYCLSGKAFRNEIYQFIRKIHYFLQRPHHCCYSQNHYRFNWHRINENLYS